MPRHSSYIYANDIGARIVVTVLKRDGSAYDLSSASAVTLKATNPSGVTKNFTASYATAPFGNGTGTDGKMEYQTTATSDLNEAGRWTIQLFVNFSASDQRHTQPSVIHVGEVPS